MNGTDLTQRTLRTTQLLSAPIDLVWEVWTNPEMIVNWWGPSGFTNTIHTMDVSEGGEWKLTMHGPDGTNYPNRSTFTEILPKEKIVFEHYNPHFITTVLFEARDEETEVDWSMLFDSPEQYDIIVKAHKADKGQEENLEKLGRYLSELVSSGETAPKIRDGDGLGD